MNSVRTATAEDLADISAVLDQSYRALLPTAYEAALLQQALPLLVTANTDLVASGRYFIVRAADGQAIGCGGWSIRNPVSATSGTALANLRHYAVIPDRAGCGIGRMLHDACMAQARPLGFHRFEVFSSLNAEGFYAALGFRRIGAVELPIGQLQFPAIRMSREDHEMATP